MQIPTPEELRERARKEDDLVRRMQGRRGRKTEVTAVNEFKSLWIGHEEDTSL